jgi:hypothetical protein
VIHQGFSVRSRLREGLFWVIAAQHFFSDRPQAQSAGYSRFDKADAWNYTAASTPHAQIYAPKHSTEPLPIVIERTPLRTKRDDQGFWPHPPAL